jgi:hypothetical protein
MTVQEFRWKLATEFYKAFAPDRMGEVDFIDFNYPVRDVSIAKGTKLTGFKDPRVSPLR